MFKWLPIFPLLFLPASNVSNHVISDVNIGFITETNERGNLTITGVDSSLINKKEIRVYYSENNTIDEIADDAFASCTNLKTLMLSRCVTNITNDAFIDSITKLQYTGSEEEYLLLGINKETIANVDYFACDEGFINYWNENIRPTAEFSICDISNTTFNYLYELYSDLTLADKNIVDNTLDIAEEKIGDSMLVLIDQFKKPQPSKQTYEWEQSGAISFIIIVAVIGMTSICVFFLLKTQQIIS